jgi:acyl carrier protein
MLAEIWQEVLDHQSIGINDSFFALGVDSILAALAITRIRDTIGVQVSMLTFFENPTITALACCCLKGHGISPGDFGYLIADGAALYRAGLRS